MKMHKSYALLSLVTAIAVAGMSLGAVSFAQTVPVACTVGSSSVSINQAAVFTATGGNGVYVWSGPNLNVTNASGNQFSVSYPNPGVYPITVTSAGQSATCSMTVVAATPSGAVVCSPATQNVTLGQNAAFAASGGNGVYVWSSPDLTISNANGTGFSANFASTGLKSVAVSSAGTSALCTVNVLAGTPTPPVTPGLPDTGGGYGK